MRNAMQLGIDVYEYGHGHEKYYSFSDNNGWDDNSGIGVNEIRSCLHGKTDASIYKILDAKLRVNDISFTFDFQLIVEKEGQTILQIEGEDIREDWETFRATEISASETELVTALEFAENYLAQHRLELIA